MTHLLNLNHKYFDSVLDGIKTFEYRNNDKDYKIGDYVVFIECGRWTSNIRNSNVYKITSILYDSDFPHIKKGYCIFSIKLVK